MITWLTPLQNVPRKARDVNVLTYRTLKKRPVIVDGVRYDSLADASRDIGISVTAVYYRVQHHVGGACYADDNDSSTQQNSGGKHGAGRR